MTNTLILQLSQRGVLTLPKSLQDRNGLQPGAEFTLLDLDGVFVLSPQRSRIDAPAERIADTLVDQGESLESMLAVLREERERYEPAS